MNVKSFLGFGASLLLIGCFQNAENPDPPAASDAGYSKPPIEQLQLLRYGEIDGQPHYIPVEFIDDMAVIEGDIIIAKGDEEVRKVKEQIADPSKPQPLAKSSGFVKAAAIFGEAMAWTDGRIPYEFDASLDAGRKGIIIQAIYEWNKTAAIRYVPYDGLGGPRTKFMPVGGNLSTSSVGMQTAQPQAINITAGAIVGTVLHEMGHAAGFYHEHTRTDRGSYVKIVTAGTDQSGIVLKRDYNILTDGAEITPYDYLSIMHYPSTTQTYLNKDGTGFFVQVKPLNGQAVSNDKLSTWDNYALWLIQYASSLAVFGSVANDATDFVNKIFVLTNANKGSYFTARYSAAAGTVNVKSLAANKDEFDKDLQTMAVGAGFSSVATYSTGGANFMLFYRAANGKYAIFSLSKDGILGAKVKEGTTTVGWTQIEPYFTFTKNFLFFRNGGSGAMSICAVNADGTIGAQTFSGTGNWQAVKPYYLEQSKFVLSSFMLFRRASDGLCRLQELTDAGGLGAVVQEKTLESGPASIAVYQGGASAFLLFSSGGNAWSYEILKGGFRDDARRQRIFNLGVTFANMDVANDVFRQGPLNNRTGTVFDMGHRMLLTWTEAPKFLFLGRGFPFL